jgi:hypothetical protein
LVKVFAKANKHALYFGPEEVEGYYTIMVDFVAGIYLMRIMGNGVT